MILYEHYDANSVLPTQRSRFLSIESRQVLEIFSQFCEVGKFRRTACMTRDLIVPCVLFKNLTGTCCFSYSPTFLVCCDTDKRLGRDRTTHCLPLMHLSSHSAVKLMNEGSPARKLVNTILMEVVVKK